MDDREKDIFFEIHKDLPREGPGSRASTHKAYNFISKFLNQPLILDIGCGPGEQTIDLLSVTDGKIIAVDNHEPFLKILNNKILENNFIDRAETKLGDMFNLDFEYGKFDLIWCEGAIYIIGFEKGLIEFGKFLKPKGFIALTEVCWLKNSRTKEVEDFWNEEYPQIKTIEENLNLIRKADYDLINHFVLESNSWMDDYYIPLKQRLSLLKLKYKNDAMAMSIIMLHEREMEIFNKYNSEYGYVFFIMRKKSIDSI